MLSRRPGESGAWPSTRASRWWRGSTAHQTILDGVDLAIEPGERLSLVGRNGAGKSTLLRILAGAPIADGGTRFVQPGTTVETLPQEPDFTGHGTVAHYIAAGLHDSHHGHTDYRVEAILDEVKL